jgi:threonyl-tRNA synthetase
VAVRTRGGEDKGTMTLSDFASLLAAEIASRGR